MNRIRKISTIVAASLVVFGLAGGANAFTDQEIDELFKRFDTNGDGKVDRTEYDINKVRIIYRKIDTDPIAGVTFEQTRISRQFFDSLDRDHDGRLTPIELLDGLRFERITGQGRNYFELADFRRFMHSIEQ